MTDTLPKLRVSGPLSQQPPATERFQGAGPSDFAKAPAISGSQSARDKKVPEERKRIFKIARDVLDSKLHDPSSSSFASSLDTAASVLQGLAAAKGAKSRPHADVSYLHNKKSFLEPPLQESTIPKEDHVVEKSFMPVKDAKFNPSDGLWHSLIFPSNKPSSRLDAILLDRWITQALERYASRLGTKADLSQAVEDLVPLLSMGLHELVRQVAHHCVERGVVLEKIWRTYVELFDRVLKELKAALFHHKARTRKAQEELETVTNELEEARTKHPQQMQRLISTLENKFSQRQQELEEQLKYREQENATLTLKLREVLNDLDLYFPCFAMYKSAPMTAKLQTGKSRPAPENATVDEAIVEDFKRILNTLVPEKRKKIGQKLQYVLGFGHMRKGDPSSGDSAKETEALRERVRVLEAELQALKGDSGTPVEDDPGIFMEGVGKGHEGEEVTEPLDAPVLDEPAGV
uniref:Uncharacterized protein n=1 Tax=Chromera velia CCMP2878 TaxID=1169474 RepID=A0A0G4IBC1_9ALVE|eukprot:Cvel_12798.t1-p1 / transcript=Cvel_12798.t1 / gene=Cvel_12798 / organism=Chromera_velia_CCMP2878 / gene_product=hypothetical protein / transcript_product=hypothetical protein / location=Cvel_scaffold852:21402-22787(-) / protein_length=462 / sequence_SO=supercontig / SO=protein_coding / is_pseudo=false